MGWTDTHACCVCGKDDTFEEVKMCLSKLPKKPARPAS